MMPARGDVVLIDFPFTGGGTSKVRPVVIVQNDRDNKRLTNTIAVMVTSRTDRAAEPTQIFVDLSSPEGLETGLLMDSVVNCINVFTFEQSKILRRLGRLSPAMVAQLDSCLKEALGLHPMQNRRQ